MLRILGRRERRPLWVTSAVVLALAVAGSIWAAVDSRAEAIRGAGVGSELTAQADLSRLLLPRDLEAPVVGPRHGELAEDIRTWITDPGPIEEVRLYSSLGRILYASNPDHVGTRPSFVRDVAFEVAAGGPRNVIRGDALHTYVPIWLTPDGTVAVAEMTQPFGPIAASATRWYVAALILGALTVASLAMVIVTGDAGPTRTAAERLYRPPFPRRRGSATPMADHPRFRAIEEQRLDVQRRAEAAEENFRTVQQQLRHTLAQMKDLEGRLAMNDTLDDTNGGDLEALRAQLRETAERLHKAELDNNALRERMTLRQQELDEARQQLAAIGSGGDPAELKARLEEAELRTAQMAHEIERLETELDYTNSQFHMTKLTEALREFDNDLDEPAGFDAPTVIIHDGGVQPTKRVG